MTINRQEFLTAYDYLSESKDLSNEQMIYVYFLSMIAAHNEYTSVLSEDFLSELNGIVSTSLVQMKFVDLLKFLLDNSEIIDDFSVHVFSERNSINDKVNSVLEDEGVQLEIPTLEVGMNIPEFIRVIKEAWYPKDNDDSDLPKVVSLLDKLFEHLDNKFEKHVEFKSLLVVRRYIDEMIFDLRKMGKNPSDKNLCEYFERRLDDLINILPTKNKNQEVKPKTKTKKEVRSFLDIDYDAFPSETKEFNRDIGAMDINSRDDEIINPGHRVIIPDVTNSRLNIVGNFESKVVSTSKLYLTAERINIEALDRSLVEAAYFGEHSQVIRVESLVNSYIVQNYSKSIGDIRCDSIKGSVMQFVGDFRFRSDRVEDGEIKFLGPKISKFKIDIEDFIASSMQESSRYSHNYENWDMIYANNEIQIKYVERSKLSVPPGTKLRISKVDSRSIISIQGGIGKIDIYFGDSDEPVVLKGSEVLEGVELGYYTKY